MLLSAIAATIALVLVQQTVLIARSEAVRSDYDAAYEMALAAKTDLEAQLAADPQFYLRSVYRYERPRMCVIGGTVRAVIPDEDSMRAVPWPQACPATWTYLATGQHAVGEDAEGSAVVYDPAQHPVRAELSPPAPGRPVLGVRILARYGGTEAGIQTSYRRSSVSAMTLYSGSDLRLGAWNTNFDDTAAAPATVTVSGVSYSAGRTYLPVAPADYTGARVLAEGGFVGTPGDTGQFFTRGGGGTQSVRNIRLVAPAPLSMEALRSGYTRAATAACSGTQDPQNFTSAESATRYATHLCLRAGRALVDTSNTKVYATTSGTAAGAAPAAYLLMFTGNAANPAVKVYTAAVEPAQPGACLIACNLTALAKADYVANRSAAAPPATVRGTGAPGEPLWQPLGEFAFPSTGVIATDADTYLGQCPRSVGTAAAPACAPTTAKASITVLAGTPTDPADVFINGPLGPAGTAAATPALGLVATGSVVFPFTAVEPGKNLTVHANLVAMGYGRTDATGADVRAFPEAPSGTPHGGKLTVVGSVASARTATALPGWSAVSLVADPATALDPPPQFPGFSETWTAAGSVRLSPYEVCGAGFCGTRW